MSTVNLDDFKRRYGLKQVRLANWKDPTVSNYPAKAKSASQKPALATYRVTYHALPQPTDDEESQSETAADSAAEPGPSDALSSKASSIFDGEPPAASDCDVPEAAAAENASELPPCEQTAPSGEGTAVPEVPEKNDATPPQSAEQLTSDLDPILPAESGDSPSQNGMTAAETELPEEPRDDQGGESSHQPCTDDQIDERRVAFAPGTPDPAPTQRKKKASKGTKSKRKKIAVAIDDLPVDVLAMIDEGLSDVPLPPQTPLDTSAEHSRQADDSAEPKPVDRGTPVDDEEVLETTVHSSRLPAEGSGSAAIEVVDVRSTEPPAEMDERKKAKKKSSRFKKDGSRQSEVLGPLDGGAMALAGLGIDLAALDMTNGATNETLAGPEAFSGNTMLDPLAGLGLHDLRPPAPSGNHAAGDVRAEDILPPSPSPAAETATKPLMEPNEDSKDDKSVETEQSLTSAQEESPGAEQADKGDMVEPDLATVTDSSTEPDKVSKEDEDGGPDPAVAVNQREKFDVADVDQGNTDEDGYVNYDEGGPVASMQSKDAVHMPSPLNDSGVEMDESNSDALAQSAPGELQVSEPISDERTDLAAESVDVQAFESVEESSHDPSDNDEDPDDAGQEASTGIEDSSQGDSAAPSAEKEWPSDGADERDEVVDMPENLEVPAGDQAAEIVDPAGTNTPLTEEFGDIGGKEQASSTDIVVKSVPIEAASNAAVDLSPGDNEMAGENAGVRADESSRCVEHRDVAEDVSSPKEEEAEIARDIEVADSGEGEAPTCDATADPAVAAPPNEKPQDSYQESPPSPVLSKTSSGSGKRKADHWERKHVENAARERKPHGSGSRTGKDTVRPKRRSRRDSLVDAEEEERRRRRAERKAREAAREEEERCRTEAEERERRIRRRLREAEKLEERARKIREEATATTDVDGQKDERRTGRSAGRPRSSRSTVAAATSSRTEMKIAEHVPAASSKGTDEDGSNVRPASPQGDKSRHRHRSQRSDYSQPERIRRNSETKNRRPATAQKRSSSFLGSLFRRL